MDVVVHVPAVSTQRTAQHLRSAWILSAAMQLRLPRSSNPHLERDLWRPTACRLGQLAIVADPALYAAQGAGGLGPGQYRLVTQFPRRVFLPASDDDQLTLGSAGLTGQQEALLVEPV